MHRACERARVGNRRKISAVTLPRRCAYGNIEARFPPIYTTTFDFSGAERNQRMLLGGARKIGDGERGFTSFHPLQHLHGIDGSQF